MRSSRKGQVAIFIIIGVFLVVVFLVAVLQKPQPIREFPAVPSIDVEQFMQGCLEQGLPDAVDVFGRSGGVYEGEDSLFFGGEEVAVWFDGESLLPERQRWLEDLATVIEDEVSLCVAQGGLPIVLKEEFPHVSIAPGFDASQVTLVWPMEWKEGSRSRSFSTWNARLALPLGKVYDDADSIVDMVSVDRAELDVDTLLNTVGHVTVSKRGPKNFLFELAYPWGKGLFLYRFGVVRS